MGLSHIKIKKKCNDIRSPHYYIKVFLVLSFLMLLILIKESNSKTLDDVFTNTNNFLEKIGQGIKKHYLNRCSQNCKCSVHSCSLGLEVNYCDKRSTAEGCECEGNMTNRGKSVVFLDNLYKTEDELMDLIQNDINTRRTICFSARIDEEILKNDIPEEVYWIYFSTFNGIFRLYPGMSYCIKYDHRLRPWWIGAITGSKNLFILIENSKELNDASFALIKTTAKRLITGTNLSDRITVMSFNENLEINIAAVNGNEEGQLKASNFVDSLVLVNNKGVNIKQVIEDLFNELLILNKNGDIISADIFAIYLGSGVTNSSGDNSINATSITDLWTTSSVNKVNLYNKIFLISYSYVVDTSNQSDNILYSLICLTNGLEFYIGNENDIFDKLNSFYSLLQVGNQSNTINWSSPYLSTGDLGYTTTASLPIYDDSLNPPLLIGTISADIQLSFLLPMVNNNLYFIEQILEMKSKSQLTILNLSDCIADKYRTAKCLSEDVRKFCPSYRSNFIDFPECNSVLNGSVFCIGDLNLDISAIDSLSMCCYNCNLIKTAVIIIISFIVVLLIIWIIVYLILNARLYKFNNKNTRKLMRKHMINIIFIGKDYDSPKNKIIEEELENRDDIEDDKLKVD